MKKYLYILLVLSLLLSGCSNNYSNANSPSGSQPNSSVSDKNSAETSSSVTVVPEVNILSGKVALAGSDNLWVLKSDIVNSMPDGNLMEYKGNLLFYSYILGDKGCTTSLALVDSKTGDVIAEGKYESYNYMQIVPGDGKIALFDDFDGAYALLDESLKLQEEKQLGRQEFPCVLGNDLDTLYIFDYEYGVYAKSISTGEQKDIILGMNVYVIHSDRDYTMFYLTDEDTQKNLKLCLDNNTGAVEAIPIKGPLTTCVRQGNSWVANMREMSSSYKLKSDDTIYHTSVFDSTVELLGNGKYLLSIGVMGDAAAIYTMDGRGVSKMSLAGNDADGYCGDFVYSEAYGGIFFVNCYENSTDLMFWDINANNSSVDSLVTMKVDKELTREYELTALYDRAKQISDKYGITVRIAEQCEQFNSSYSIDELSDAGKIEKALDELESVLSCYPEGFFKQLAYGDVEDIYFDIVDKVYNGDVTIGNNMLAATIKSEDRITVVFNASAEPFADTLHHEIAHVIDYRLAFDSSIRSDALFSESEWLKYQPPGFTYDESYIGYMSEKNKRDYETGYFLFEYSCLMATEDRATLFSAAMCKREDWLMKKPMLSPKLEFYSKCIRDCFNTDGWPEETLWESMIIKSFG